MLSVIVANVETPLTNKSIEIPWKSPLMCQLGDHSFGNMEHLLIYEYT